MILKGIAVYEGEWWCPGCSRSLRNVLSKEGASAPLCPRCGTRMEEAGTGDDDPYPDDPDWRTGDG